MEWAHATTSKCCKYAARNVFFLYVCKQTFIDLFIYLSVYLSIYKAGSVAAPVSHANRFELED